METIDTEALDKLNLSLTIYIMVNERENEAPSIGVDLAKSVKSVLDNFKDAINRGVF